MNVTGFVLAFPAGIVTGILGQRAGVPSWICAIVGACAGVAILQLSILLELP
jgi:hypothetical protein